MLLHLQTHGLSAIARSSMQYLRHVKIAFGFVNNSDLHHKGGSLKIVFRMS